MCVRVSYMTYDFVYLTQVLFACFRNAGDLRVVADKIATYSNQLRIVASVLQNGPGNPEVSV